MIVLGIDPGTTRIGYGFIEKSSLKPVAYGTIEIKSSNLPEQLVTLQKELSQLIKKYKPERIGVEKLFFAKNRKTALDVAHARGVIILTAAKYGVPILEFSPGVIKQGVTGYGSADKKSVVKMVSKLLNIPELHKEHDDAADALAVAITTAHFRIDR